MAQDSSKVIVDTIKSVGGIIGVQASQSVATLTTTDVGHLVADISTGLIAFLTLANLIKSLFFTKH